MRYRTGVKTLAEEIKDNVKNGQPWNLTFAPTANLSTADKMILEKHLQNAFKLWANSWVIPNLDDIIAKYKK